MRCGAQSATYYCQWQGTLCDGQHQAKDFSEQLNILLGHASDQFHKVVWDPTHLSDLAVNDVFKGAVGESSDFMECLVSRSAIFHQIFSRGKMFMQEKMQADVNVSKMLVTSRTCPTRFSSLQYNEFCNLLESLPTYIEAFRNFNYSESQEYQIAGQDFLFDLCAAVDILKPAITLLLDLQSLQSPVWKISFWHPKVLELLKKMEKTTTERVPRMMTNLNAHIIDIKRMQYKGTQ